MANSNAVTESDIVSRFLLNTCSLPIQPNIAINRAILSVVRLANGHPEDDLHAEKPASYVPSVTGSVAEFYITPLFSCVGDADVMFYQSSELSVPLGWSPPSKLPDEFHSEVYVYEIIDTEWPGYVYIRQSHLLIECPDEDKYKIIKLDHQPLGLLAFKAHSGYGPALAQRQRMEEITPTNPYGQLITNTVSKSRIEKSLIANDSVACVRCLEWPPQAADWPTRHRKYGWPDSATVDRVVSNGCDVVGVAHRQCRQHEWKRKYQWRLSFSRAEIVLLNSWTLEQQIVYHMLRIFVKVNKFKNIGDDSSENTLSNYHLKTLMLWSCELKTRNWWKGNLVKICTTLLHNLTKWLAGTRYHHYFVQYGTLFDFNNKPMSGAITEIVRRLTPLLSENTLTKWFLNNYVCVCGPALGFGAILPQFDDSTIASLQASVTQLYMFRNIMSPWLVHYNTLSSHTLITIIHMDELTVRSCAVWMDELERRDSRLRLSFTAFSILHVACEIRLYPKSEFIDILTILLFKLSGKSVRRQLFSRRDSASLLKIALQLLEITSFMKQSRLTVDLIQIEVAKIYLHKALSCKGSDSNFIYCLANVHLVVLYYNTRHYQTAIDHCTQVMKSQDHSQCSSHVVEEYLAACITDVSNVISLAALYQYVTEQAVSNMKAVLVQQECRVFTMQLFANYLMIRCLSAANCSSVLPLQRYHKNLRLKSQAFITDILLLKAVKQCPEVREQTKSNASPHLIDLLKQFAVEHLTRFRQLEYKEVDETLGATLGLAPFEAPSDYEALLTYARGDYEKCFRLCERHAQLLTKHPISAMQDIIADVPLNTAEFTQLLDDEIVSFMGVMLLVKPTIRDMTLEEDAPNFLTVHRLTLSVYLLTQCHVKLSHPIESVSETLRYLEVAQQRQSTLSFNVLTMCQVSLSHNALQRRTTPLFSLNELVLILTERILARYIATLY